ncbi:ABATE domain-containing protein [Nonomuraea terrae]|uniref:ABATE domain-containing protein n=1 Tax=Nonomuraea terrae TaxID=2530383 RepID=UPI001404D179|nr:ABATE domain-containing protein [Nonomuraea terrae]
MSFLALEFVSTVRAARTGMIDLLSDVDGMTAWVREHAADLGAAPGFSRPARRR